MKISLYKEPAVTLFTSQKLYCAPEHKIFPILYTLHSCKKESFYSTYFLPVKATFTVAIVLTIQLQDSMKQKTQQEG